MPQFLCKNSVKLTFYKRTLLLIWRKKFCVTVNFTAVWKNIKRDHAHEISWNQLFSNFFHKTLFWRKKGNFSRTQCNVVIWYFSPQNFLKKVRQINVFTKELYCKSIWRKNFQVGENLWNYHTVRENRIAFCSTFPQFEIWNWFHGIFVQKRWGEWNYVISTLCKV